MKRLISLLLFLLLSLSLFSCDAASVLGSLQTATDITLDGTSPDESTPEETSSDGTSPAETTPEETTSDTLVLPESVGFQVISQTYESCSFRVFIDSDDDNAYIGLESFFNEVLSPSLFHDVIYDKTLETIDWFVDEKPADANTKIFDGSTVVFTTKTQPETTTPEGTTTPEETTPALPDNPNTPSIYDVEAAITYIDALYRQKDVTTTDFLVTAKVFIAGISYDVAWFVNTDKITIIQESNNTYIIDVDENSKEEVEYVLTAIVTAPDGTFATTDFYLTLPRYDVTSFEDYMAAENGDTVTVRGIVVTFTSVSAGNRFNRLFLADLDGKGGYYCYNLVTDPIYDIKPGMIVEVTGTASPYSGMQEIKDGTVKIVDSTPNEIAPLDVTEQFANGESFRNYVGLPVTIQGVEIGSQELDVATSQYLFFKLNGRTSYVRTNLVDFPFTLSVFYDAETGLYFSHDKDVIDAEHAKHFGWLADVTGVVVLYDGNPYLIPMSVDCFTYREELTKAPDEKVYVALEELALDTSFNVDALINLPTTSHAYPEVSIAWTTNDTTGAVTIVDGNLCITIPDGALTVKVTATATYDNVTDSKTFTIKLSRNLTPIKDAIDIGLSMEHNTFTTDKYIVAGVITEVYSTTYGNMRITDEFGNILTIYGSYLDGERYGNVAGAKPVVGDYIVLSGILGQYNGTPQMKNADILSFTSPTSLKEAIEIGAAQEYKTYTTDKYLVTGIVTEVYNTLYGNMRITDEYGNIFTLYGTFNADGTVRYDAMAVQPVAGDTVTVYGVLGQYNGAAQMKNGWIVAHTAGTTPDIPEETLPEETTPSTPEEETTPNTPDTPDTPTLEIVDNPIAGSGYVMVLEQKNIDQVLYFAGYISGYYLATTDNAYEAATVYVEAVEKIEGAYRLYFMNGEVKTYIEVCERMAGEAGKGKGNVQLVTEMPTNYYTYDSTIKTFVYTSADGLNSYYLGTYNKYTTLNASNLSYITGDNASTVDVSQFPVRMATLETSSTPDTPDIPVEPEAGTVVGIIHEIALANGWEKSISYDSFTINDCIIVSFTATSIGGYGLNSGKYYESDNSWRLYQNETPELTIATLNGKNIVCVKITYISQKYGALTLNGENIESETIVYVNDSSITFGVGNTNAETQGQARITAIEVILDESWIPDEPAIPEETIPEETTPIPEEETSPEEPVIPDVPAFISESVGFRFISSTDDSCILLAIIDADDDAYIDLASFFNYILAPVFGDMTYEDTLEYVNWYVDGELAQADSCVFGGSMVAYKTVSSEDTTPPTFPEAPTAPDHIGVQVVSIADGTVIFRAIIDADDDAYIDLASFVELILAPLIFGEITYDETLANFDWYVNEAPADANTKVLSGITVTIKEKEQELPPAEDDDGKTTIVFYHTMGSSSQAILDKYIAEFNELYPDIIIKHKQIGDYDDVRDQIKTELAVGEHPNIAYCYPDHVASYNLAKAVKSLDDLIGSTNTVTRADGTLEQIGLTQEQIDNFIDAFYNEGKAFGDGLMYTMPMSRSTEVLYYNKTFFDEHGIQVPTTWDEMEAVCALLKELDPDCIPLGYDSEANWFITMCEQMNSPYTSATGDHVLFDNEINRNFVARIREWYQMGYVTTQEISGAYTSSLFTKDPSETANCYMCISSSAGARYHRSSFEVGIASIPQVDPSSPKVISQGPSLCIFNDSNEAEVLASWLFVKFLITNVDFQAEFSMNSGYMPVLESVVDHPVYQEELKNANGYEGLPMLALKVALEQADAYFTSPAFNGSAQARDVVGQLLQHCLIAYTDNVAETIQQAFKDAIEECNYRIGN